MNQNIWGPGVWTFLHSVSLNYPTKPSNMDKNKIYNFLESLGKVLPCKYCRQNYKRHITEMPVRLESRKDFFEWTVDLHNAVNKQEDKSTMTYKEVLDKYEKIYNKKLSLFETHVSKKKSVLSRLYTLSLISAIVSLVYKINQ